MHSREDRLIESETKVRRQISEIYCKTEQDFASVEEYNEYLELREDIIYRLVSSSSQAEVQAIWQRVGRYHAQNSEQILREQGLQPRKKAQKIFGIIESEGNFCSSVNAEWGERDRNDGLALLQHPFRERYRDLLMGGGAGDIGAPGGGAAALSEPGFAAASRGGADVAPASPFFAPQPLLGEDPASPAPFKADPARHASGGGQPMEARRLKARHFFFADLASAAAMAAAAAAAAPTA